MGRRPDLDRLRRANPVPNRELVDKRYAPPADLLALLIAGVPQTVRDELDRLRGANPVPAVALASPPFAPPAHLLERILTTPVAAAPTTRESRPRRRSRALRGVGISGAVAASIAIAAVAWTLRQPASATASLDRLADHARQQEALVAGGGYLYSRITEFALVGVNDLPPVLVPRTFETWVRPNGSGRRVVTTGQPKFFSADDRARWVKAGRPTLAETGVVSVQVAPGDLSGADLGALSTDPPTLLRQLRERAAGQEQPGSYGVLERAREVMVDPGASPRLRSAVLRAIAQIDGLEIDQVARDEQGRAGLGVSVVADINGRSRYELVFNRESGDLLGSRVTLLEHVPWLSVEPPRLIGAVTLESQGVVPSPEQTPRP